MFRRIPSSLPEDPKWPTDLKELGFFIDDSQQIKSIEHPTDYFRFWITNSDRWNDVHREAMHACIRKEVVTRLADLNVHPLYLPTLSTSPPESAIPHLPILMTPPDSLREKIKVIVVVNSVFEDLAIWAYRVLSREGGIDVGSAVAFVTDALTRSFSNGKTMSADQSDSPGIVILNPGQLLYSYKHSRAMTPLAWDALPRPSAVHPPPNVHPEHNHVAGNKTAEEHIDFVFSKVLANEAFVSKHARFYLVGIEKGGDALLDYLSESSSNFQKNIAAVALTGLTPVTPASIKPKVRDPSFLKFLASKARAWDISSHPLGTPLANPTINTVPDLEPCEQANGGVEGIMTSSSNHVVSSYDQVFMCPTLSGGHKETTECIMPIASSAILDWFREVAQEEDQYKNEELVISAQVMEERTRVHFERSWDD